MRDMLKVFRATVLIALVPVALAQGFKAEDVKTQAVFEADAIPAGQQGRIAFSFQLPPKFHVNSNKPLEENLIPTTVNFELPEGISLDALAFPEPIQVSVVGFETPLAVFEEHFAIGARFSVPANVQPGAYPAKAKVRIQACNETSCFPPKTLEIEFTVNVVAANTAVTKQNAQIFDAMKFEPVIASSDPSGSSDPSDTTVASADDNAALALLDQFTLLGTSGYVSKSEFIKFIDEAETGVIKKGAFEDMGPVAMVLAILGGGLLLNLTPCVLPMVPINLAIIGAGAKAGSKGRGFALGGVYGLAMAAVYGALGLLVILTGSTFGAINSFWWFNAGIAALFVGLALGMFDIINIDFTRFQSKLNLQGKSRGTFALAFIMGAVAALLAGACVAPVVIAVILYAGDAYLKGNTVALALPFLLGVGMALPWPFAGGGMSFLPKPGKWMSRVKQAFGVFILGFSAYYGYQAYEQVQATRVDSAQVQESVDKLLQEGWHASLSEGLKLAKAENKNVLIDVWATWCKNCLVMDKTVLKDPGVLARLDGYIKIKYQAQYPDDPPAIDILDR
ncbi:MAG: cytochrome c biogenesis protein CcdA, partial [Candidatus Hydrogenedentota bacterium]